MVLFILWLIVAILLFGTLCYAIGRTVSPDEDVSNIVVASFFGSICWPAVLAIVCVLGPFVISYNIGAHHREIQNNKDEMWQTLKK